MSEAEKRLQEVEAEIEKAVQENDFNRVDELQLEKWDLENIVRR